MRVPLSSFEELPFEVLKHIFTFIDRGLFACLTLSKTVRPSVIEALYTYVRLDTRAADIRWSRFSIALKGTPLQPRLRHIRRLSLLVEGTVSPLDAASLLWFLDTVRPRSLSITLVLSGEPKDWPVFAAYLQRCAPSVALRITPHSAYHYSDMARDVGVVSHCVHTLALEGVRGDLWLTSPMPSKEPFDLGSLLHLSLDDGILYDLGWPIARCRRFFSKEFIPNLQSLSLALQDCSYLYHDLEQQKEGVIYLLEQHGGSLFSLSVKAPEERCHHYIPERLPDLCPALQSLRMTDLVHIRLSYLPATLQLLDLLVCNSKAARKIVDGLQSSADTPSHFPMLRILAIREWRDVGSEVEELKTEAIETSPEPPALVKLRQTCMSRGIELWSTRCRDTISDGAS